MAATDLLTPLNAANVLWKAGEDDHQGILHNYGNLEVIGGVFNTVHNVAGPSELNQSVTLGTGYMEAGFLFYHEAYPAALGTYYHPANYYHCVQYPFKLAIKPTTITVYVEDYSKVDSANVIAYIPSVLTTYGKLATRLIIPITTRTVSGSARCSGFIRVYA